MTRSAITAFILAATLASGALAQTAYVRNALGSQSSQTNVLAPQMLATVSALPSSFSSFVITGLPHLANTTADVFIRSAGSSDLLPAPIVSANPTSITFVVPAGVPYGSAELIWRIGTEPFQWVNVTVAHSNFELAPGALAGEPGRAVGLSTPARPGQAITLTGSGLGYGMHVAATVGGAPATVIYAGRGSPSGYDQIQVEIPAASATGCYVPLTISFGDHAVSSPVSVTSDGSPCSHPLHLSPDDLQRLDAGGSIATVVVSVSTGLNVTLPSAVHRDEYAQVSTSALSATDLTRYFNLVSSVSGCRDNTAQSAVFAGIIVRSGVFSGGPAPLPDLGRVLSLQTRSTTLTSFDASGSYWGFPLPAPLDGTLSALPANILSPGQWTLSTPGSDDLQPSSFQFDLPTPVRMDGGAPILVSRDGDQTFTWNGGAFGPNAIATVFLNGKLSGGARRSITCTSPAPSGSLTIPAALLGPFATHSVGSILLQITSAPQASGPPVKLKNGSTLAQLTLYTTSDSRPVDFQ